MTVRYELRDKMTEVSAKEARRADVPVVEAISSDAFRTLPGIERDGAEALKSLEASETSYVEVYPGFLAGSFAVPDKADPTGDPLLFSFYLEERHLIFIEDGTLAESILATLAKSGVMRTMGTAHCLYLFFKTLLMDDLAYLGRLEDAMEDAEEAMIEQGADIPTSKIMAYRRTSSRLGTYYQQVAAMATIIADDENKLMDPEDARAFTRVSNLADRLVNRAEIIKEYSGQLHELHQTRIDLKQNSIMQTFTIVTVLFAPLTLITGWFGMNLTVLPGVDWPWMAAALVALAVVTTSSFLAYVRGKHWL